MDKIIFLTIFAIIVLLALLSIFFSFKILKENKFLKWFFFVFIFGGLLSFFIPFFLESTPKIFQEFGFTWLIFMPFYIFTIILTYITKIFTRNNSIPLRVYYLSLTITVAILFWGRYNFYNIKEVKHIFNISNSIGKNIRIAAVSDLHLGDYINKNDLKRYVTKINNTNPDIVVLAGDVMDRELKPLIEQDMSSILKEIKAPMGVYAVLGNHEGYGRQTLEEIKDFYNKANITLLIDSVVKSNPVVIMGRNDIHKGEDRVGVIEKINSEGFNSNKMPLIILSHKPLEKEEMEPLDSLNNNIIFYISGHTHNGQVYPFSKIVKKMYTHYYGLFTEGKVNYITSSGIGLWGPKVRLGTQSEIVVIDLVGDTSFQLPARDTNAISGSEFVKKVEKLPLQERELLILEEILNGNIPDNLREFRKVEFNNDTNLVEIEILNDYLSLGSNDDFIRMPMTPILAQIIADSLNCSLPTAYLVDQIAKAADGAIEPFPFRPFDNRNEQIITFEDNNNVINALIKAKGYNNNQLISGMRKDIIITHKISSDSSRLNHVTIYGWHYPNGKRIQPSNNIHSNDYVDYSHGVRLIKRNVKINGKYYDIQDVLTDPIMYEILSDEDRPMIKATYAGDTLHTRPLGT